MNYGRFISRFFTYWQPGELDEALETAGFTTFHRQTDEKPLNSWLVRFARSN